MREANWLVDMEAAEAMGLDPNRVPWIGEALREAVRAGDIPGGVAVVSRRGRRIRFACGNAVDDETGQTRVSFDTIYDCASLTKIAVTLPLALRLAERGQLRLDEPAASHLPALAAAEARRRPGAAGERMTLRHLLTHTAGLAPFYDLHSRGFSREEIVDFICQAPPEAAPGARVAYSDLGYILLGEIIAKVAGRPLPELAAAELFAPLGMASSGYLPAPELRRRIASTAEPGAAVGSAAPGDPVVVHDENARALAGVSGHAGLFATADDLASYAELWLAGGYGAAAGQRVLSAAAVEAATRPCTAGVPGGCRGLGWVLRGDPFDAAGDLLSPVAYGHTGFTGTSLYVDPPRELACVLLTNRVHYGRDRSVAGLRAKFHNAAAAAIAD
ncbi:beta-lactamase family protein [Paenibacillus timonensis]|uniref:Serine hydrolase domain-containing protein n=1 Tax=Paenibacillus timonensis TaxID=225915 RepID=A0ABW3S910_9BACL|nr:serine hydrolase domain-containing protein [Paenibacillus timonensis]MCH1639404.1 beta-lactamase family protein [Paenibacillus timonensis]